MECFAKLDGRAPERTGNISQRTRMGFAARSLGRYTFFLQHKKGVFVGVVVQV